MTTERQLIEKLNKTIKNAKNSKLYKKKYATIDTPLKNLREFKKIPFTTKEDLRTQYPY